MRQLPISGTKRYLFLLIVAVGWMSTAMSSQAQGSSGVTLSATAGFDGLFKAEYGMPVYITAANDGPAVEGQLRIVLDTGAPADSLVYSAPVSLPTQSNKRLALFVHLSGFATELEVSLVDADGNIVALTTTNRLSRLAPNDLMYGVISSDPGELSYLETVTGTRSRAAVAFLEPNDLPVVPPAWNSLDLLVLNDTDTGEFSSAQMAALRAWISTGGQLVVTGGPGWQKTASGLSDMLPVAIDGSESFADLPALNAFAGVPFRDAGPYLVTTSSLRNGEMLLHQDGLPLLARRSWGRGRVHFLALDPRLAPLLDWDGSELLWSEIVSQVPELPLWGLGVGNGYAASTAVTSLPSLALPSTLQLALFLLFYAVVVGPINYLVLRRMRRRELAWVTIPLLVLLFSGMAYLTGFQLKGNEVIINQMSIAYGRIGGDQMRIQTLLGLYSPRRGTYDLMLPFDTMARPFERNFGNLGGSGNLESISRGRALTLSGIRVDVSGTQTFIADSVHALPDITADANLFLDGNDIRLDVAVQNDSNATLENASLLLGADILALGDIAPGRLETGSKIVGASATTAGGGIAAPPAIYGPPPGPGVLMSSADTILGTNNYYNDREAFPRWQLLQAIEGDSFARGTGVSSVNSIQRGVATLVAWSDEALLDIELNRDEYTSLQTTLLFLEIPLEQDIVSSDNVSVPISLLDWEVLAESGTYEASIQNLYLQGGWVEFEYRPWGVFQGMQTTQLAIVLESQSGVSGQPAPEIRLWDWRNEFWMTISTSGWGTTQIDEPQRYLGPANAVRIRLQGNSSYGADIRAIYPLITGKLP